MAKTRSKPASTSTVPSNSKTTLKSLPPPVNSPPQLVVLPKDASPEARIISINNTRYFIDPTKGACYEFTRISPPKSSPRSWLLSSEQDSGYILSNPSLLLATPIDPLFLLLPCLTTDITSASTEYLAPSDYLSKLSQSAPHLTSLLRSEKLATRLESRIEAVCDCMSMGDDEKLYAFSLKKLGVEMVSKATRMASKPLPKSMEERFVTGALDVPVLSIRREESGISIHGEKTEEEEQDMPSTAGAEPEEVESQESSTSGTTTTSIDTTATSLSLTSTTSNPSQEEKPTNLQPCPITPLLRLRTSLDFLLRSYIPTSLHPHLCPLIDSSIDWNPLTTHLERIATLKKEAQALRSLGENFSRKRGAEDDEGREELLLRKRTKKEEEATRAKKGISQGVKKLAKVDRSGMKSLTSFFGKK